MQTIENMQTVQPVPDEQDFSEQVERKYFKRSEKFIEWCSDQINDDTAWSRFSFISQCRMEKSQVIEERFDTKLVKVWDIKSPKQYREIMLKAPDKERCPFCNYKVKQKYPFFRSNVLDAGEIYHVGHLKCILQFCGLFKVSWWSVFKNIILMLPFSLMAALWLYSLLFKYCYGR